MDAPVIAEFLGHIAQATWQASFLALVVWLVTLALGEHLNAEWRCRLWLLVIVRLAWPVSLPSPVSLFNLLTAPAYLAAPDESRHYLADELAAQVDRWSEHPWVILVWSVGAGVVLLRALMATGWAMWVRWTARPAASWEAWWLLQECKEVSGLGGPVAILESSRVRSPCLLGLFRPVLVLPTGLHRELTRGELKLVLLHELAHLRRRDLALNWVLAAVEVFHWFNPIVWTISRRIREEREEACDAHALTAEPAAQRAYGEVLLKLIERVSSPRPGRSPLAAGLLGDETEDDLNPLVHRLRAIMKFRPGTRTWVVGFCTWLAVALVGLTDPEPRRGEAAEGPVAEVER